MTVYDGFVYDDRVEEVPDFGTFTLTCESDGRDVSFEAPGTVTFRINDAKGMSFDALLSMNYMFAGER